MNKDSKVNSTDRIMLLQTWARIVEAGSLSKAAVQLNTTQPTISRRLKTLETILGSKLLLRTTHQLKLTDEGERCYELSKEIVAKWETLTEMVGGNHAQLKGRLRVRVPHAFGQEQLILPLMQYLKDYPQMHIDWLLNDQSTDFLSEDIDCAIQVGQVSDENVIAKLLCYVPRIIVASPQLTENFAKPQHPQDLEPWPWIAISTYYRQALNVYEHCHTEPTQINIEPVLSTDNIYSATQCAKRGLGITSISSWLVQPLIDSGELVQILPNWQEASLPLYLVYPYAQYYSNRLTTFIALMQQAIPQMIGIEPAR